MMAFSQSTSSNSASGAAQLTSILCVARTFSGSVTIAVNASAACSNASAQLAPTPRTPMSASCGKCSHRFTPVAASIFDVRNMILCRRAGIRINPVRNTQLRFRFLQGFAWFEFGVNAGLHIGDCLGRGRKRAEFHRRFEVYPVVAVRMLDYARRVVGWDVVALTRHNSPSRHEVSRFSIGLPYRIVITMQLWLYVHECKGS